MSGPTDRPWSNNEKVVLLAEMVKSCDVQWTTLWDVIQTSRNYPPLLEDIPLPPGRSLTSSRHAYNEMSAAISQRTLPVPPTPSPFIQPHAPKRPFQGSEGPFSGSTREIRPKPLSSAPTGFAHLTTNEPPPKRKRGRPTRAEAQERAAAAAAAGGSPAQSSALSTPIPASTPMYGSTYTDPLSAAAARQSPYSSMYGEPSSAGAARPTLPVVDPVSTPTLPMPLAGVESKPYVPTTRLPVSDMLTPSAPPHEPPGGSNSGSSSGKPRRARSTRSEPEDERVRSTSASRQTYESPYARIGGQTEVSPARTAVLRHREESTSASSTAPPGEGAEERKAHPRST